jgi:hypothetical protein
MMTVSIVLLIAISFLDCFTSPDGLFVQACARSIEYGQVRHAQRPAIRQNDRESIDMQRWIKNVI